MTTGDNTDNNATIELDWFLTVMSGGRITPDTGDPRRTRASRTRGPPLFWQPESARTTPTRSSASRTCPATCRPPPARCTAPA